MRTLILLSTTLLLAACGQASEEVQNSFNQELRKGFIQAATERCVAAVPQNSPLPAEKLTQICSCTAETLFEQVSAEDLANIASGKTDSELTAKISRATVDCAGKALSSAASAASAAQ